MWSRGISCPQHRALQQCSTQRCCQHSTALWWQYEPPWLRSSRVRARGKLLRWCWLRSRLAVLTRHRVCTGGASYGVWFRKTWTALLFMLLSASGVHGWWWPASPSHVIGRGVGAGLCLEPGRVPLCWLRLGHMHSAACLGKSIWSTATASATSDSGWVALHSGGVRG